MFLILLGIQYWFKNLLKQGILEQVFYGDLHVVYTFIRIVRKPNFSDQFKKIIKRSKKKFDIT